MLAGGESKDLGAREARGVMKVSAIDVRQSYTSRKARTDLTAHLWIYLVLRPISFALTPFFINLGLSANAVTALGLIPLICGLVFILLGAISPVNFVIGAALINIWYLCDCIDGNIARFRGRVSKFGALFDWMVGRIYHAFLPACLGLGLYLASPERSTLALGLGIPRWFWLLTGGVELFAGLLRDMVSLQTRRIVGGKVTPGTDSETSIRTILPGAILSFKLPLLLVASLAGALPVWLLGYVVYNLTTLVAMILLALRKARLADQQQFDQAANL